MSRCRSQGLDPLGLSNVATVWGCGVGLRGMELLVVRFGKLENPARRADALRRARFATIQLPARDRVV